jgi:DNA-binding NarL/FixJ family response regulator
MIHQTYKVLLVEDVLVIAKITEQMLKKSPTHTYVSTHTTRLADSIAALKAQDFDVVLLDLNLPDSRDLATLTSIVEVAPEVPIVVLTATGSDEVGLRAVQMSAIACSVQSGNWPCSTN